MTALPPRIDADQLRRAVSMLDLLPPDAPTRRIGSDAYVTMCVFHAEDRPSLRVTLFKGVWRFKCFPCGAAGDVLDFVQRTRGVTFKEAVASLATGRTFDLSITTKRKAAPAWMLVCDECAARRTIEADNLAHLTVWRAPDLGWHVGGHRVLCADCVEKRQRDPYRGGQQASFRRQRP